MSIGTLLPRRTYVKSGEEVDNFNGLELDASAGLTVDRFLLSQAAGSSPLLRR
jgi:hypothetical protein